MQNETAMPILGCISRMHISHVNLQRFPFKNLSTHKISHVQAAREEFLAQNDMVGLFEMGPQHMKIYVSKSINSAHVFVKPEDLVTTNEPTFPIHYGETIEATLVFSPNIKSISCSLTTTNPRSINQCEFLGFVHLLKVYQLLLLLA